MNLHYRCLCPTVHVPHIIVDLYLLYGNISYICCLELLAKELSLNNFLPLHLKNILQSSHKRIKHGEKLLQIFNQDISRTFEFFVLNLKLSDLRTYVKCLSELKNESSIWHLNFKYIPFHTYKNIVSCIKIIVIIFTY